MRRAKSPAALGFNRYDEERLKRALKRAVDKRMFQRVQAVLLVAQGRAISEVALMAGVSLQTVYTGGTRSLTSRQVVTFQDAPRSGRPRTARPVTPVRILREIRRTPLQLGYRTTVWTVPLLTCHLSRLSHCTFSPYTLRRRMKAGGLRCKRPRYVHEEKAPHRARKKGLWSAA
ncbi:MAG: helix-turn-helix domain-containing protein [Deltaproteobacteria bacterium]|nr:helix-turn-helix domain-containing protein [Deltaproteobacteria bacterium]